MSDRWDAIIVGAGPAGSAIASALARRGFRVLLIDRAEFPRDKLCGEFLSAECWPMLDSLGVVKAIQQSGFQSICRLQLRLPGGGHVEADLPRRSGQSAIGLSRQRLDLILLDHARAVGVTVVQNLEVTDLCEQSGVVFGLLARTAGSRTRRAENELLHSKLVVAADGRRSTIVGRSGRIVRAPRSTPDQVCAVKRHYRTADGLHRADTIALHSFPGGYAGTCGVESDIVNFCTLLPLSAIRNARGCIERALHSVVGGSALEATLLREAQPVSDWKTIPDIQVQWAQPCRAGVLYVGDAMGTVDPLGGEGMEMALEGAMLASGFAERAIAGRSGCDASLQQRYHAAWHSRFARRIQLCRAFSWLLARPAILSPLAAPFTRTAWTHALLPLAFRATRGQADLIGTTQPRR
jgi:flavin-dependent dehydrogenase